jgi:hypothetical protein
MPNGISFNSNNPSKRILHFKIPYEISTEPFPAIAQPPNGQLIVGYIIEYPTEFFSLARGMVTVTAVTM